jgi:hypothetical protein
MAAMPYGEVETSSPLELNSMRDPKTIPGLRKTGNHVQHGLWVKSGSGVRGLLSEFEIRNPKLETSTKSEEAMREDMLSGQFLSFGIPICSGFRDSCFESGVLPFRQHAVWRRGRES